MRLGRMVTGGKGNEVLPRFGTPYPRSAGFDTDIGAFIESSSMSSPRGLMARLVLKHNIISGGALAPGQTLRLGGFVMTAASALKPTMTSQVIENRLRVDPEYSACMDPMELSSLNELLDRIAALGSLQTMVRLGLNPIREKSNLHRSSIR